MIIKNKSIFKSQASISTSRYDFNNIQNDLTHDNIWEHKKKTRLRQLQIKSPKCLQLAQCSWLWCYSVIGLTTHQKSRVHAYNSPPEGLLLSSEALLASHIQEWAEGIEKSLPCPPWLQPRKTVVRIEKKGQYGSCKMNCIPRNLCRLISSP